ncbi:hypothetical protein C8Q80DRAFT_1158122 [Daedaleopsis nitida]|nr:hypothetical protein C8Q80DRAFT_1158122 [Daedaleopsis nitida]
MESSNLAQTAPNPADAPAQATAADLILLIFIHGFKGTDSTFGEFPQRLRHVLTETLPNTTVEDVIFPAYETKGELNAAVVRFADWLTDLTVRREVANGGAGRAKIVLCGHSMGGLLAADALAEFVNTRPDKHAPLWPNIVACIAYDTPYLGLHPHVFKNSASQAADYVRQASNVLNSFKTWRARATSGAADTPPPVPAKAAIPPPPAQEESAGASLWQKWAMPAAVTVGGALFAGAAGAAYYKREDIGVGYTWVTDHLRFVGNMWSKDELEARLDKLLLIESRMGVLFQTFFTYLPASPPNFPKSRTFAVLPHPNSPVGTHFAPNRNTLAADEIQAHTGMFDSKTNDGYYDLGLKTAHLIREAVLRHRTVEAVAQQPPVPPKEAEKVKDAMHSSATAKAAAAAAQSGPAPEAVVVSAAAVGATAPVVAAAAAATEDDEEDDEDDEEEEGEEEEAIKPKQAPKAAAEEEEEDDDDEEDEEDEDEEDDEEDEEDDEDEDEEEEEEEEEETKPPPKTKA